MTNKQGLRLSTAIVLAFALNACAVVKDSQPEAQAADLFAQRSAPGVPIMNVGAPDSNGFLNYQQSNMLMNLTTDQGSAIVVDMAPQPYKENDLFTKKNKRLTVSYAAPNDDLATSDLMPTDEGIFNHSIFVVGAMMNDHPYVIHPGFMGKHGRVHLIAYRKYSNNDYVESPYRFSQNIFFDFELTALSDEVIKWAKKGYLGFNASWGGGVTLDMASNQYWLWRRATTKMTDAQIEQEINDIVIKYPRYQAIAQLELPTLYEGFQPLPSIPYQKPDTDYNPITPLDFDHVPRKEFTNDLIQYWWKQSKRNIGFVNAVLDRFQLLATKYDMNITLSAGNSGNRSQPTQFSSYQMRLYADLELPGGQRRWKDLSETMLSVAIDNPYINAGDYSNSCATTITYCVSAYGWAFARSTLRPIDQSTYGPFDPNSNPNYASGTSFAAPYTQSVVQMVRSVFPFFDARNAQVTVTTTAKQTYPGARLSLRNGWGLIQPQVAVNGPEMFWARDFEANFTRYPQWIARYGVYTFSNNISGPFGLTVIGNDKLHPVLSLAGNDTYEGATVVKSHGILYVPGVVQKSQINIEPTGKVIADGQVAFVRNNGELVTYAPALNKAFKFKPRNKNSYTTGLLLTGDLEQSAKSTLAVALGKPVLVKGQAVLAGKLRIDVAAFAKKDDKADFAQLGQLKDGKVVVMVSEHPFKGQFSSVVSADKTIVVTGKVVTSTMKVNGKTVYTLSVPVKIKPAAKKGDKKSDKKADKKSGKKSDSKTHKKAAPVADKKSSK